MDYVFEHDSSRKIAMILAVLFSFTVNKIFENSRLLKAGFRMNLTITWKAAFNCCMKEKLLREIRVGLINPNPLNHARLKTGV